MFWCAYLVVLWVILGQGATVPSPLPAGGNLSVRGARGHHGHERTRELCSTLYVCDFPAAAATLRESCPSTYLVALLVSDGSYLRQPCERKTAHGM